MISIGEVLGEPEQDGTPIDRTIKGAMQTAKKLRNTSYSKGHPRVNVVFHIPGRLLAPDWSEARVERFSRKNQLLLVSIAVPKAVVDSDEDTTKDFVVASLHTAVKLAFVTFSGKGIEFPLADADILVEQIEEEL